MKHLTNSKAVNAELSAMPKKRAQRVQISTENKVFIVLGGMLILSIVVNALIHGIPTL